MFFPGRVLVPAAWPLDSRSRNVAILWKVLIQRIICRRGAQHVALPLRFFPLPIAAAVSVAVPTRSQHRIHSFEVMGLGPGVGRG